MNEADTGNHENPLNEWLASPELKKFREMYRASELRQSAEDQAWWDSLTMEERSQAFRQVVKLMHKAEVEKRGSYRYAIYDVFEVDYADGMSHYMELHNLIFKGLEAS